MAIAQAAVRSKQEGADAVVGNNDLRRFNVIFDYANRKLHIRPNSHFLEPFDELYAMPSRSDGSTRAPSRTLAGKEAK